MIHSFSKSIKTVLIGLFFLAGINGCNDDYNSVIPYMHVEMNINPSNIIELIGRAHV